MRFGGIPVVAWGWLAVAGCSTPASDSTSVNAFQRGVCWVAAAEPVGLESFRPLLRDHVDWISQTTFGWQRDAHSPELVLRPDSRWWGESDSGVVQTAKLARQAGLKTLLSPHLWGRQWSGDIEMGGEAEWEQWFANYRRFILHYAQLAAAADVEALCIGTELQGTTAARERDWRELIAAVREVYPGRLVYAANWDGEFARIRFWDALDFIGIQAYFPVADHDSPTIPELLEGWKAHLERLDAVHRQYGKPVLVTEMGYRSEPDAAIRPWYWERSRPGSRSASGFSQEGLQSQAHCYEAFFQAFSSETWFAGVFVWKWHPLSDERRWRFSEPFTPQDKPAEEVLREWYGRAAAAD